MDTGSSITTIGRMLRRRAIAANDTQSHTRVDPELRLPKTASLVIIIVSNLLLQVRSRCCIRCLQTLNDRKISFFIIVSSANAYVQHLGGTSVLSGVTLGVPTVCAALVIRELQCDSLNVTEFSIDGYATALMMKYDQGMLSSYFI
jgi:hypothetical protein